MRVFFGAVVGAIVVFVWGWVAWAGIDLYGFAIKGMPNEEIAVPALQANLPESGAYYFPAMPGDMKDKAAMDAYAAKHQAGPIGKSAQDLALLLHAMAGFDPRYTTSSDRT